MPGNSGSMFSGRVMFSDLDRSDFVVDIINTPERESRLLLRSAPREEKQDGFSRNFTEEIVPSKRSYFSRQGEIYLDRNATG